MCMFKTISAFLERTSIHFSLTHTCFYLSCQNRRCLYATEKKAVLIIGVTVFWSWFFFNGAPRCVFRLFVVMILMIVVRFRRWWKGVFLFTFSVIQLIIPFVIVYFIVCFHCISPNLPSLNQCWLRFIIFPYIYRFQLTVMLLGGWGKMV